ncbi:von Willebrand factor type A domain protein [compost metagenome]
MNSFVSVEGNTPRSVAVAANNSIPAVGAILDDKGAKQGVIENGGYTDDSRPQITGAAAPGVVVHLYDGTLLLGRATAGADGEWQFNPRFPLVDGRHEISVIYQYPDDSFSDRSAPHVIHVDNTPPDTPVILGMTDDEGRITGTVASEGITDDNRPTVEGTSEANATVIVYDKGKEIGRAQADGDGKWSFTPEPPLEDGTHILDYVAVDRAGNQSDNTGSFEFLVDTRPELVSIHAAEDGVGSTTGILLSGSSTDDVMPTLRGTATAGGIVKIYEGNVLLGQTTAGVDGRWTFTPDTALSEGAHTLQATVTLVAKGESARSLDFNLVVDLSAPNAPSITEVIDNVGSLQGVLANGAATDDATPLLMGKAEAGSTVRIHDDGKLLDSTVADANGNWSFTSPSLTDGEHRFTAVAEDASGNTSAHSDVYGVVVDITPPGKSIITSVHDDAGRTTGEVAEGAKTDDDRPTISGTAEPNGTVVIKDNGVEIGRAPVGADGKWSFEPSKPLAWGGHSVTAEAIDGVGNTGAPSDVRSFILENSGDDYVDLTSASAPVSVSFIADVSGSMGGVGITQLKASLTALVNAYAERGGQTTFNLIAFHSTASNRGTFTFNSTDDISYKQLISSINSLTAGGGTSIGAGLVMAADLIKAEYAAAGADAYMSKQVFLLSDGQTSVPDIATWKAAMNDPDGNPATHNSVEVTSIGLGGGVVYTYLDAAATSGTAIRTPNPADLKDTVLQNMFVSVAEGNVLENDVQVVMDKGSRLSQLVLGTEVFKINAAGQLEVSNPSGKVAATYDAATGLLTLKTAAGVLTIYMKGSTGHDAGDFKFRGYSDGKLHLEADADYVYGYTAVNSKGESQTSDLHILSKVPAIGADAVTVTSMGKDTSVVGAAADYITADGSAGRLITGAIKAELGDGLVVQVSTDGGATWHNAKLNGKQWAFVDMQSHSGNWDIQTRIADGSGKNSGVLTSQAVTLVAAGGAPSIVRILEAEGIYTVAKAADGSQVLLSLAGTGAKAGDIVHVQWGSTTYDQALTQLDVNSGLATINVPATATYTIQGAAKDFSVTAQIIGKEGAIGAVSSPYAVVGTYTTANVADTLQKVLVGNEYLGTGFKVTSTGSLSKTAATTTALAGLTLSSNTQAEATFALDKPARYFTLRLTGVDNNLGAQIQVFDVKGNLIHSENFIGGTDARHTKVFTFTSAELVDIGSFKVVTLGSSITLDAFSQVVVTHTAETRDPNLIDYASESFMGTAGNDVMSLSVTSATYFSQASAGIHGGAGIDTLKLVGANHQLNLTTAGSKVSSMEIIDLTGTGNNTLTLGLSQVLENGGVDAFYVGDKSRVQMLVNGNAGDKVNLSDLLTNGNDHGDWVKGSAVIVNGLAYDTYQHSSLGAELLVQLGVTVAVTNSVAVGASSSDANMPVSSVDHAVDAAMLTLNVSQVLNDGSANLFHDGDRTQMLVNGNAGDSINLDDLLDDGVTDLGDWAATGSQSINGLAYTVYQHSGMDAELLVQESVKVNLV